jgi:hypothetical protein
MFIVDPRIDATIVKIARDIEYPVDYMSAGFFYSEGILDDYQYKFLREVNGPKEELSPRQLFVRKRINLIILNSLSDMELFQIGIDVSQINVAENGWYWGMSI